jgi:hypothetical protein
MRHVASHLDRFAQVKSFKLKGKSGTTRALLHRSNEQTDPVEPKTPVDELGMMMAEAKRMTS